MHISAAEIIYSVHMGHGIRPRNVYLSSETYQAVYAEYRRKISEPVPVSRKYEAMRALDVDMKNAEKKLTVPISYPTRIKIGPQTKGRVPYSLLVEFT
jgi:hypothetical protein